MYQLNHYNGFGRQCVAGCAGFSYHRNRRSGRHQLRTAGGNPFASFLLGYADSGSIDTIRFIGQQWPYFAGYFQDDWRVIPKLTLNLGLRWETQLPPTGLDDRWSDFSPTTPNPGAGNIPGRGDLCRSRHRAASASARWPIPISRLSDRTSVSPTR